jgi:hypothetical protein
MKNFFHYEYIEKHHSLGMDAKLRRDLLKIRKRADAVNKYQNFTREHDFYSPDNIYIVHRRPKILKFSVDDVVYEIIGFASGGAGWSRVKLESKLVGRIYFKKLVSIDRGIDAVWTWKRWFSQVASQRYEPEEVSISAKNRRRSPPASVYLPNVSSREGDKDESGHFGPHIAPFNRWNERDKLSEIMKAWIRNEPSRRRFRVNLDSVISRMRVRHDVQDIVVLCSAVESLPTAAGDEYDPKKLDEIASSADAKAASLGVSIQAGRVRGLLSMLSRRSLPDRLREIFSEIEMAPNDQKSLIKNIKELRTIGAHGVSISDETLPEVNPVVVALASACILFEMKSAGFDLKQKGFVAKHDLQLAIARLHQIDAEHTAKGARAQ